jgi:AraC-like DNA-binding protein
VLSLLKPRSYISGGFALARDLAIQFPRHRGIKCYAVVAGHCWLAVEGVSDAVALAAGDCIVLPRGLPFRLATDLSLTPIDAFAFRRMRQSRGVVSVHEDAGPYLVGGHFSLGGDHTEYLLEALPPVIHILTDSDKAAMRWSLERMDNELRDPQPGASLIAQQLAYVMLVQALRLHLAAATNSSVGWLAALSDAQMNVAIGAMHNDPAHRWTLQELAERVGMSRSIFALKFKEKVGATPMEYLTRWRMLLAADMLRNSDDSVASIGFSLGYESESAFRKAFRGFVGCSPREYGRNPR